MPDVGMIPGYGYIPTPAAGAAAAGDWFMNQLQDLAESRQVYNQYRDLIPQVRAQHGPMASELSDEALMAQMMTHDRGIVPSYLQPAEQGFLVRDPSGGHDPALAAAEHRAFVQDAVREAPGGRVGAGLMSAALGAATPGYAAIKALGLKRGSAPSLAQLVSGLGGAWEANQQFGVQPGAGGLPFIPSSMVGQLLGR